MPQSLSKILIHLVFSTKSRFPFLADKNIRKEMHAYLGGICNKLGCKVLIVGGYTDHVHVLCFLSRNFTVSKLVGEIKRESSKWIKSKGGMLTKFAWQNGYAVFSIGQSEIGKIKQYIMNQEILHKKKQFREEYIQFLNKYEIEFDDKYILD